jgi:hypothetical protein
MPDNISITELDFFAAKEALKNYLKGQTQFQDYDFDGANMNVLLDVMSYNTYMNNFYTNMAYSEMFLDSAQTRPAVISHAKELNYLPRSCVSAAAKIRIDISPNDFPTFITIPKGTKFTGRNNNINTKFTFSTDRSYTVTQIDGLYCLEDISIFEGKLITEYYTILSGTSQRFILNNTDVDVSSITVSVRTSADVDSISTEYTQRDGIFGVTPVDPVFYIQPTDSDSYEITFGKNVFGKQPLVNNIVQVSYRISSKEAPNGIRTFTSENISGYPVTVTTTAKAEGGLDRESIESIRFFAPKSIQIQDRAVTESDYEIILKNQFPEIQAISVYGGEELVPPRYGRVVVAVDVQNAEGVSDNNKVTYYNYLKERCPIGIEPIIISPEFMYLNINTNIQYNTKTTSASESDIRTAVKNAIIAYSDNNLSDFKKTFRESKLISEIDAANDNILSNDTEVLAIIPINPVLDTATSYALNFKNALVTDHMLVQGSDLELYKSAITSSQFQYQGRTALIQDNGMGALQVIRSTATGFVFINRNIGSVNYETGRVVITNLKVSGYSGSEIKIFARSRAGDIVSPKDRIITIREEDINITVYGTRE